MDSLEGLESYYADRARFGIQHNLRSPVSGQQRQIYDDDSGGFVRGVMNATEFTSTRKDKLGQNNQSNNNSNKFDFIRNNNSSSSVGSARKWLKSKGMDKYYGHQKQRNSQAHETEVPYSQMSPNFSSHQVKSSHMSPERSSHMEDEISPTSSYSSLHLKVKDQSTYPTSADIRAGANLEIVTKSKDDGQYNRTYEAVKDAAKSVQRSLFRSTSSFAAASARFLAADISKGDASSKPPRIVSADDITSLLLWREPKTSGIVLGAGVYALLCVRTMLSAPRLPIQPSTIFCALLILLMCIRIARFVAQLVRGPPSPRSPTDTPRSGTLSDVREQQMIVQMWVSNKVSNASCTIASAIGATAGLLWWVLHSGSSSTTAVTAACLWLIMIVGELGLFSQCTLVILIYIGVFVVPLANVVFHQVVDAFVYDSLAHLRSLTAHLSLLGVAPVIASGVLVLLVSSMNWVLRGTLAVGTSYCVLTAMHYVFQGKGLGADSDYVQVQKKLS